MTQLQILLLLTVCGGKFPLLHCIKPLAHKSNMCSRTLRVLKCCCQPLNVCICFKGDLQSQYLSKCKILATPSYVNLCNVICNKFCTSQSMKHCDTLTGAVKLMLLLPGDSITSLVFSICAPSSMVRAEAEELGISRDAVLSLPRSSR